MTAADTLLERLERVTAAGDQQWRASCPTTLHKHGDRSRGLYIREADDRVLLHCFAGCDAGEIVEAVGLRLGDLFDRPRESRAPIPIQQRWDYRALLLNLEFDAAFIANMADMMTEGAALNDLGLEELAQSAKRIRRAVEVAHG